MEHRTGFGEIWDDPDRRGDLGYTRVRCVAGRHVLSSHWSSPFPAAVVKRPKVWAWNKKRNKESGAQTDRRKEDTDREREREGGDIDINQKEEFLQPCTARGGSCRKDILNWVSFTLMTPQSSHPKLINHPMHDNGKKTAKPSPLSS